MDFEIVDVDTQDIRDAQGRRITHDTIDGVLQAVHEAKKVGRPSLTSPGQHSPSMTLRFSEATSNRIAALASAQGKPKSQIVRDAVDRYLAAA